MEMFNSLEEVLKKYPGSHVSHAQTGKCMVCKEVHDLRCGACFNCSGKVDGNPIKNKSGKVIGHELFEIESPENKWITGA